jgi:hypothetical protein
MTGMARSEIKVEDLSQFKYLRYPISVHLTDVKINLSIIVLHMALDTKRKFVQKYKSK